MEKKDLKFDKSNFVTYKTGNITKEYILGKTLGTGAFGTVRSAVHKATKQTRAVKILKKSEQDEEKLFLEVNILSKLSHPNIMQIYEFLNGMSMVMEFYHGRRSSMGIEMHMVQLIRMKLII